ncbi:hypothetical protein RJ55_06319 [Drechmeria coniospora]|nr:hypothetical protein RJ55_06319 [Drechmeria coniospora]
MELTNIQRAIVGNGVGDGTPVYELPSWTLLVLLVDLIILVPVYLVLNYTFKAVYPVFAMVENENPPAYEPVASLDEESPAAASEISQPQKPAVGDSRAVTSSMRAINRLLRASGGFFANFRGLSCALAQSVTTSALMSVFAGALGRRFTPVANLLAALALVQLSTAWVHIIISEPSPSHFWRRLPPFKRTFHATWRPVTCYWFAAELSRWIPLGLAAAMGLRIPNMNGCKHLNMDELNGAFVAKGAVIMLITVVCSLFVMIPANVILVRVQASLLPVDADTTIPFDRSFGGKVEPVVVSGVGYVSMTDAWATFSKAAWRRLLLLYVKIFFVTMTSLLLIATLLVPQAIMLARHSTRVD